MRIMSHLAFCFKTFHHIIEVLDEFYPARSVPVSLFYQIE